jgi:hypothetical protein
VQKFPDSPQRDGAGTTLLLPRLRSARLPVNEDETDVPFRKRPIAGLTSTNIVAAVDAERDTLPRFAQIAQLFTFSHGANLLERDIC